MKAGQTILKRLIEGERQYRVPLFQRPYTWAQVQLDQLWSDILDQYELLSTYEADGGSRPLRSSHFIGSFVLAPVPGMAHGVSSYLIVDGQQRLTTLLLVLAALRDWQKGKDQKAVDRLNQLYLRNEHAEGTDRYKLLPTRLDREAFFAFIDGTAPPSVSTNLEAAYRFFAGQLTKPGLYERMTQLAERLVSGLRVELSAVGIPAQINAIGSVATVFFTPGPVRNYADAKRSDTKRYARFFREMLPRGIFLAPSQFEAVFLSAAHTAGDIDRTLAAAREALQSIAAEPA